MEVYRSIFCFFNLDYSTNQKLYQYLQKHGEIKEFKEHNFTLPQLQSFMDEVFFQPSFIKNRTYDPQRIKEIAERIYLNGNVTCLVYQQHQPIDNKAIVPYLTQKIGIDLSWINIFEYNAIQHHIMFNNENINFIKNRISNESTQKIDNLIEHFMRLLVSQKYPIENICVEGESVLSYYGIEESKVLYFISQAAIGSKQLDLVCTNNIYISSKFEIPLNDLITDSANYIYHHAMKFMVLPHIRKLRILQLTNSFDRRLLTNNINNINEQIHNQRLSLVPAINLITPYSLHLIEKCLVPNDKINQYRKELLDNKKNDKFVIINQQLQVEEEEEDYVVAAILENENIWVEKVNRDYPSHTYLKYKSDLKHLLSICKEYVNIKKNCFILTIYPQYRNKFLESIGWIKKHANIVASYHFNIDTSQIKDFILQLFDKADWLGDDDNNWVGAKVKSQHGLIEGNNQEINQVMIEVLPNFNPMPFMYQLREKLGDKRGVDINESVSDTGRILSIPLNIKKTVKVEKKESNIPEKDTTVDKPKVTEKKLTINNSSQIEDTSLPAVVFYTGYTPPYNGENYHTTPGLWGSEIAAIKIAEQIASSNKFEVHIFCVCNEEMEYNGVNYWNLDKIPKKILELSVEHLIVSRYIHYFLAYPNPAKHTYLWVHDSVPNFYWNGKELPDKGKPLVKSLASGWNQILCVSEWQAAINHEWIGLKSGISIVPNGIETSYFKDVDSIEKVKNRFIFCQDPDRGLDVLLHLFPLITQHIPDATLFIFWDKLSESRQNKINEMNNIFFCGKVSQKDLAVELMKSDVWFYPNVSHETYCMAAVEAQAAKCLCVARSYSGLVETVGNRGILINGEPTQEEFQKCALKILIQILNDEPTKKRYQKLGHEWAMEQDWKNRKDLWLQFLDKMEKADPKIHPEI